MAQALVFPTNHGLAATGICCGMWAPSPLRIGSLVAPPRVGRFYPARLLPGPESRPVFRLPAAVATDGARHD